MPNKDFHLNHFQYNPTSDCLIAPQNNAVPIGTQPGAIGLKAKRKCIKIRFGKVSQEFHLSINSL